MHAQYVLELDRHNASQSTLSRCNLARDNGPREGAKFGKTVQILCTSN